jgi:hypothetical protein
MGRRVIHRTRETRITAPEDSAGRIALTFLIANLPFIIISIAFGAAWIWLGMSLYDRQPESFAAFFCWVGVSPGALIGLVLLCWF